MVFRLVLGCGSVGQPIVEQLATSDGRLLVIADGPSLVETLRDESVPARLDDPTDPAVLDGLETPDEIFIAGDRTDVNRTALERARERFPVASIVAYLGGNATASDREAFESRADRIVDPTEALAADIVDKTASRSAKHAIDLRAQLSSIDGRLGVFMHDNPDPDAIASAVALVEIAERVGLEADACYFGEISHQENRAMVNLLELELTNFTRDDPLGAYDAFALVDHARPGVNDQLPEELHVDIVIDHHPPRGPVAGEFVDLREEAGATSTIMTEYLERFGFEIGSRIATALLYGIRIDTNDFAREVSAMDFEAASTLFPSVDQTKIDQIEQPTIGGDTLEIIARAIKNRDQRESVAVAGVGRIADRDALPQAADQLLAMDGVSTTLVFGFRDEMVFLSARSRASNVDLGETLRDAFDPIGSAGGHADMAGAQLEIGILGGADDEDELNSIFSVIEEVITDRFFEAIRTRPGTPVGAYDRTSEWLFQPDDGERNDGESA
ncbi:DHH family phosphoesterase [Halostagnicola kamekurae]|uniref:NanoRNase/pAp phosphatase, hydrolyzes c-di-AMP and oligoRNAs n=1 Tax=Halostagnicola kamekurae TaxID=619731 RepID=A0A1I6S6H0_9EURY|nr:DHH family phosphoesterase [Halostagnicola kamekurae]SFS72493.1 nanoRNase/pAp phosphatase, hydrolyzes c-di-AMP and oligoRNAs [Halostagnicola kamekurae]